MHLRAMECSDRKLDPSLLAGLDDLLIMLQGSSYFVKKLSPTNALQCATSPIRLRYGQLSMPRKFTTEHGNKFRRDVELRSDLSDNRPWPYFLAFCTSRPIPEVTFAGSRWGAFVTAHGLVQGDQLVFSITAMSQFQVYIFNALGAPKGPQRLHAPMKWPRPTVYLKTNRADLEADEVNTRPTVYCKTNRADLEADEVNTAFSKDIQPLEAFSEDIKPLEAFSKDIKPLEKRKSLVEIYSSAPAKPEIRGRLIEAKNRHSSCAPSFTRRLVAMNHYRLEFPKDFVEAHGDKLRGTVQLQGIREDSTSQYTVKCVSYMGDNGQERMYMKGPGWEKFVIENKLRFKQELVFTITRGAPSTCFTVREVVSWSPQTGLNPGSVSAKPLRACRSAVLSSSSDESEQ